MQTSLQGISKRVKTHPKHRFGGLYSLLNEKNLVESFFELRKSGATGVDDVDFESYKNDLEANVTNLVDRLKRKAYRAKLVKRVYISKGDGTFRPLGILTLEDKMLQKGVAKILNAIYEPIFLPTSFGFRPNIGAKDAVNDLKLGLQYGRFTWVLDSDIKSFFTDINHDWLVKMLELKIDDRAFVSLIVKWLKAGVLEPDGKVIHPITGTPQGGIVSPILANLYLHYVLDLWFEKEVKQNCKGDVRYIRYADDTVWAFQYKSDADAVYNALKERLAKFGLKLSESKTKLIQFNRFKGKKNGRFDFLGFEFRWDTNRKKKMQIKLRTSRKKLRGSIQNYKDWIKKNRHRKITSLMITLRRKMVGYYNYYGVPCNIESLEIFYTKVYWSTYKWLNRRSGRKSYTATGVTDLFKDFNIPTPRIKPMVTRRRVVLNCFPDFHN